MLERIANACQRAGCEVQKNASMAEYTSFRIGGAADLLVTAPGIREASEVCGLCAQAEIPLLFLGNGTNLLVGDGGIRGVVLRLDGNTPPRLSEDGRMECSAGLPLKQLCRFARDHNLSGLEFAYGIPGTVGGAVYMNAGAYGGQISDTIVWAEALFPDGELRRIAVEEMALGYRRSIFMECGAVVMRAAFRLALGKREEIEASMEEFMRRRREKQPLEYPSAGSFFKRPPGHYAGALIEACGLKGCTEGGAQVSEKHAGFVINRGGATCSDVHRLSDKVQEIVFREHGVRLEPEVRFVGQR